MAKTYSTRDDRGLQPQTDQPAAPAPTPKPGPHTTPPGSKRNRTVLAISHTLESLKHPGYRYMWIGSLVGMGGFTMLTIARTVFVDDLTGSAFITSLVAMGFAPTMLIMSLFGGVAGDRMERRLVIQLSQGAAGLLALVVALLIAFDVVHWVHLFIASMLQGVTFAFQMPARQAILPNLVGKENVTNAVALNSAGMGIMSIVAPGIAGVLYSLAGAEAVYFVVAGMSLLAVLFTARLPRFVPEPSSVKKNIIADIVEGVKYTWHNRLVFLLLVSGLTSALLAMPFRMQIPVISRRLYDIDVTEIGWLMAAMGTGGLLATAVTANLREGHHRGPILIVIGIGGTGVAMLLLAISGVYMIGLAIMVAVGFVGSIRMTLGQSIAIEATSDEFRARVMSLNMMVYGLMPLGAMPMGYAIDHIGAENTLLIVGTILLVATAALMLGSSTLRRHS
ncbi:MAG: MFS transporter [Dehalococcoidia bacterium]|jgi:MFS family permease|nr:MFS transporter [Dehalococcoidia bacterium]